MATARSHLAKYGTPAQKAAVAKHNKGIEAKAKVGSITSSYNTKFADYSKAFEPSNLSAEKPSGLFSNRAATIAGLLGGWKANLAVKGIQSLTGNTPRQNANLSISNAFSPAMTSKDNFGVTSGLNINTANQYGKVFTTPYQGLAGPPSVSDKIDSALLKIRTDPFSLPVDAIKSIGKIPGVHDAVVGAGEQTTKFVDKFAPALAAPYRNLVAGLTNDPKVTQYTDRENQAAFSKDTLGIQGNTLRSFNQETFKDGYPTTQDSDENLSRLGFFGAALNQLNPFNRNKENLNPATFATIGSEPLSSLQRHEDGTVTLAAHLAPKTNMEEGSWKDSPIPVVGAPLALAGQHILGGDYGADLSEVPGAGHAWGLAKTLGAGDDRVSYHTTTMDQLKTLNPQLHSHLQSQPVSPYRSDNPFTNKETPSVSRDFATLAGLSNDPSSSLYSPTRDTYTRGLGTDTKALRRNQFSSSTGSNLDRGLAQVSGQLKSTADQAAAEANLGISGYLSQAKQQREAAQQHLATIQGGRTELAAEIAKLKEGYSDVDVDVKGLEELEGQYGQRETDITKQLSDYDQNVRGYVTQWQQQTQFQPWTMGVRAKGNIYKSPLQQFGRKARTTSKKITQPGSDFTIAGLSSAWNPTLNI